MELTKIFLVAGKGNFSGILFHLCNLIKKSFVQQWVENKKKELKKNIGFEPSYRETKVPNHTQKSTNKI